jgi:hypothetical protein
VDIDSSIRLVESGMGTHADGPPDTLLHISPRPRQIEQDNAADRLEIYTLTEFRRVQQQCLDPTPIVVPWIVEVLEDPCTDCTHGRSRSTHHLRIEALACRHPSHQGLDRHLGLVSLAQEILQWKESMTEVGKDNGLSRGRLY